MSVIICPMTTARYTIFYSCCAVPATSGIANKNTRKCPGCLAGITGAGAIGGGGSTAACFICTCSFTHKNVSSVRPANVPSSYDVMPKPLSRSLKSDIPTATAGARHESTHGWYQHKQKLKCDATACTDNLRPCIHMQCLRGP